MDAGLESRTLVERRGYPLGGQLVTDPTHGHQGSSGSGRRVNTYQSMKTLLCNHIFGGSHLTGRREDSDE